MNERRPSRPHPDFRLMLDLRIDSSIGVVIRRSGNTLGYMRAAKP
jgi:hypothetical protein